MPFKIGPNGERIQLNIQTPSTAQPMQSSQPMQPIQNDQPEQGGFVMNFLKAIVNPAIRAGKDVLGSTVAGASGVGELIQRSTFDPENKSKFFDKGIQQGIEMMTPEYASQVTGTEYGGPMNAKLSEFGTTAVKRGAGAASYLVPGGATGKAMFATGAAAGFLNAASEDEMTPKDIVLSTVFGGVGGYVGGQLTKTAVKAVSKVLGKGAKNIASSSVSASPSQQREFLNLTGKTIEEYAVENGLVGRDPQIAEKAIKPMQEAFDDIALNSGARGNVVDVVGRANPVIEKYLNSTSEDDKAIGRRISKVVENFIRKYGDGEIDVSDFTKERRNYDKLLNTKDFGTTRSSASVQANKEVRFILQDVVSDITSAEKLPNGMDLKDLGQELKALYAFRTILEKQAGKGKGSSVPFSLLSKGGGGVLGLLYAQDDIKNGDYAKAAAKVLAGIGLSRLASNPKFLGVMASALEKSSGKLDELPIGGNITEATGRYAGIGTAGALQSTQPDVPSDTADTIAQTASTDPFNGMSKQELLSLALSKGASKSDLEEISGIYDMLGGQETSPTAFMDKPDKATTGYSSEQLYTGIMNAYASGDSKSAAYLEKMYKLALEREKDTGTKKDKTEAQVARDDLKILVEDASKMLEGGSVKTGIINAPIESVKATLGVADQETLDFNTTLANLTATLAKARAGTSFTANEQKLLEKYTPTPGDSKQQLETKLRGLKKLLD